MRPNALLPFVLALAACHSGNNSEPVLGSVTIGPEGGTLTITSGVQQGLQLQVPAGALTTATELRVVDLSASVVPPGGGAQPVTVAPPGYPLRIEPVDLRFEVQATLLLPYLSANIASTAPGNVRARQVRSGNQIDLAPAAVDVGGGRVTLHTRSLGQFTVVAGPGVNNVQEYAPPVGSVSLAGGFTFAVELVPPTSPFASADAVCWHITGPQVDERIYLQGDSVVGRESPTAQWRERWNTPFPVWTFSALALPGSFVTSTQVEQPIGGAPNYGTLTANGGWTWSDPRMLGNELIYDVLKLRLQASWNSTILGLGQRSYVFTLSPGHGLLALSLDSVEYVRPL